MKRVLLDQGLAPLTAKLLRSRGWDALHVSEVDLDTAHDSQILAFAAQESRTCVTLDHDFHAHLALSRSGVPSVVFLRAEGLDADGQTELICNVWSTCESAINQGATVSADSHSVRIRLLPLR